MKKIVIVLLVVLLIIGGCEALGQYIFENIEIELEDQLIAPIGEYTIPYNYSEINNYIEQLGLTLSITVLDEEDYEISVTGNSFVVEEDMTYYVTIVLSNKEGETKSKSITVRAVNNLDLFTITFDSNGGSEVFPLEFNYDAEILMPDEPTKDGYVFGGWYTDSGLTEAYEGTTMPANNFTLYAKWLSE